MRLRFLLAPLVLLFLLPAASPAYADYGTPHRLTTRAVETSRPSLAIVPGGKLYVAWMQKIESEYGFQYDIYGSLYENGQWKTPERLSNTAQDSIFPRVAADSTGKIHVVWREFLSGNNEVAHRTLDGTWSPSLSSLPENVSQSLPGSEKPAAATDTSGDLHVVWTEGSEVYYRVKTGGTWGSSSVISDGTNNSGDPDIAIGPDGGVNVVWKEYYRIQDDPPAYNFEIVYRKKTAGWSVQQNVSGTGSLVSQEPRVTVDTSGTVGVAWEDQFWTSGGEESKLISSDIWVNRNVGGVWEGASAVDGVSDMSFDPAVSSGSGGKLHLAWEVEPTSNPYNSEVYYRRLSEGTWSAPENVSQTTLLSRHTAIASMSPPQLVWVEENSYTHKGVVSYLPLMGRPTNLVAAERLGDFGDHVDLTWTASSDPQVIGYNVYGGQIRGGPYTKLNTEVVTSTTFDASGLTPFRTYYFTVKGTDGALESIGTDEATAVPVNEFAPGPPTNVNVLDVPADDGEALDITWNPSPTPDATTYTVYRSETAGEGYVAVGTTQNMWFRDTGLLKGHLYFYVVTASNAFESNFSEQGWGITYDDPPWPTQLTIKSKPSTIVYSASTTLSGTITSYGVALPGRSVRVWAKPYGASKYSLLKTLLTGSGGAWQYNVKPSKHTLYKADTVAAGDYRASSSSSTWVRVAARVSFGRTPSRVRRYQRIAVWGTVSPNHRGRSVSIMYSKDGVTWKFFKRLALSRTSRFSGYVLFRVKGRYWLRAAFGADADHYSATSGKSSVTVY